MGNHNRDLAPVRLTRGSGGQGGVLHLAPKREQHQRRWWDLALSPDSVPIPSPLCPPMDGSSALGPRFTVGSTLLEPHVHSGTLPPQKATSGGAMPLRAVTLAATLCKGENGRAEVGLLPGPRASPLQHASSTHALPLLSGEAITSGPFLRGAAAYLPKLQLALPPVSLCGVSPTHSLLTPAWFPGSELLLLHP